MKRKLLAIALSVLMAWGCLPPTTIQAAQDIQFTEDEKGNRTGLKSITIAPYTYVNMGNEEGKTFVNTTFLENLVNDRLLPQWAQFAEDVFRVNGGSAWNRTGGGFEDNFNTNGGGTHQFDISSFLGTKGVKTKGGHGDTFVSSTKTTLTDSLQNVRNAMGSHMNWVVDNEASAGWLLGEGINGNALAALNNAEKTQVFYKLVASYYNDSGANAYNRVNAFGIAFYDFDMAPISDKDLTYITAAEGYKSLEDASDNGAPGVEYRSSGTEKPVISYTENYSKEDVDVAMSFGRSSTTSLKNSIENSSSYSFREVIGSESEFNIGEMVTETISVEFSSEQAFGEARTEEKGVEKTIDNTVQETLRIPAQSAVAIEQSEGNTAIGLEYACPVAITFKVAIFAVNAEFQNGEIQMKDQQKGCFTAIFGSDNAISGYTAHENLYTRAVENKDVSGFDETYGDTYGYHGYVNGGSSSLNSINWNNVINKIPQGGDKNLIKKLATTVPMASAGAEMQTESNSINSNVRAIVPLYHLNKVKLAEGEKHYTMTTGDELDLDSLSVKGYNANNVPYYGFDENDGEWVLTDENGKPMSNMNPIASFQIDTFTGRIKLEANGPGRVYLKWMLKEGVTYNQSKDNIEVTRKDFENENSNIEKTAFVRLDITDKPFEGKVFVEGEFIGKVDAKPESLSDKLKVTVEDLEGKEYNDRIITWEAKEPSGEGISVGRTGLVLFTKPGTYHVRAKVSEKAKSDWVAIEAREESKLARVDFDRDTFMRDYQDKMTLEKATDVLTFDLAKYVRYMDQYGDPFTSESNPEVNFSLGEPTDYAKIDPITGVLTVTASGTYRIKAQAQSGDYETDLKDLILEIKNTPFDGTVTVSGNYTGIVNQSRDNLNKVLKIQIRDTEGKEQGNLPVIWDAQEIDGIKVEPDGEVTFTKSGTYHVRAIVSGTEKSDWHAISARNYQAQAVVSGMNGVTARLSKSADIIREDKVTLTISLEKGRRFTCTPSVSAQNASAGAVVKKDENTFICTLSQFTGDAKITVTGAEEAIPVSGVALSGPEQIKIGETAVLTCDITPQETMDRNLTFTSSHPSVLSVDIQGRVTALKAGRAVVTARTVNGKSASWTITVKEPTSLLTGKVYKKKYIRLSWNKISYADGYEVYASICDGKMKKQMTVKGKNVVVKKVNRKSLKTSAAYKFKVRPYKMVDGKKIYLTMSEDVHVTMRNSRRAANATAVKTNKKKLNLNIGKTAKVKVKVSTPHRARQLNHTAAVRYISTDPAIASVNKKGKITGRTQGQCDVYAIALNGKAVKIQVTVQ